MSRYIDAEKLKKVFRYTEDAEYARWTLAGILGEIDDIEAADVVEVVRCKDCQYRYVLNRGESSICNLLDAQNNGEAYCSYGERKDG